MITLANSQGTVNIHLYPLLHNPNPSPLIPSTLSLFLLFLTLMKSIQDLSFIPKSSPFLQIPATHLPFSLSVPKTHQNPLPTPSFSKISSTHLPYSPKIHAPTQKNPSFFKSAATHLKKITLFTSLSLPLPSFAAEIDQASSDKINIESILISVDDFFNRYPFFVAGCTVIWLVVIPLTEEYLKKYKFISVINAYRKLEGLPNSQLLDIRKEKSFNYLNSPNLKLLGKSAVQVEFVEGEEDGFVNEVLKRFSDPEGTVLCIVDNFDGNSLKVAELLFKNGFKEAYAIKGGLRGKDGWQEIQETFLPPSVHVYPRKKKSKTSVQLENIERIDENNKSDNGQIPSFSSKNQEYYQNSKNRCPEPMGTSQEEKMDNGRPLSPYSKYPDLRPPSSPTPSKPQG